MGNPGLLLKMIPLALRIKKRQHREIAAAQDLIVRELYRTLDRAVLHGGTAIWRCYAGNRFSEDIDAYIQRDTKKIDIFFENLEKIGFHIQKKKIGKNSIFSSLQLNRTEVRFEATFQKKEGMLGGYETADGNWITVYTLPPEELIKEKVEAYLKRLKIRDLYDIFFLMRYVKNKETMSNAIKRLVKNFQKPVDEKDLKILLLEGLVPDSEKMLQYLKDQLKWKDKNT